jgi:7-keto-8-aminopelargonate synthetase-like enzyme
VVVYRHLDCGHLEHCLHSHRGEGRRLIVTDSVFSMDGDVAPLAEILGLARTYDARVVVDEAHATGALGPGGRGAIAQTGLRDEVDVLIGTLGKALGSYGAYVCASEEMVRYLVNTARPLIFSTAPSPPSVAGALAALELLEEHPHQVARLHSAARALRGALAAEGFGVEESDMHIVPLLVGDSGDAVRLCEAALKRGVFAQAIRPPTVPYGTSRLRLAAMASHTTAELRQAAKALGEAAHELGLDPAALGPHPATRDSHLSTRDSPLPEPGSHFSEPSSHPIAPDSALSTRDSHPGAPDSALSTPDSHPGAPDSPGPKPRLARVA